MHVVHERPGLSQKRRPSAANHDFRKVTLQYYKRVKKTVGKVLIHSHSPIKSFSTAYRINTLPAPAPSPGNHTDPDTIGYPRPHGDH
jgi:hypothetical protein